MPTVYPSTFGPTFQWENGAGEPAVGDKVFFYIAGSNTKQNTYTESTGSTANPNPVVLNALGMPPDEVWFEQGLLYKVVWAPSTDTDPPTNPIRTWDNLSGIGDPSFVTSNSSEWVLYSQPATFVSGTSFTVAGDQTSTFQIGRRVKTENSGGAIVYSTITNSVFGAVTTVTLANDSGSIDSGISAVYYGIISPSNTSFASINSNSQRPALSALQTGTGALIVTKSNTAYASDTITPDNQFNTGGSSEEIGLAIMQWYTPGAGLGAQLHLCRSNSTTIGTHSAVGSNNIIGAISFSGSDGTKFLPGVVVGAYAGGAVSTNIVPGFFYIDISDSIGTLTRALSIDASANKFFGASSTATDYSNGLVNSKYISGATGTMISSRTSTGSVSHINFTNPNGTVGSVMTSGTTTTYATTSDPRLKKNIVDLKNSGAFIDAIRPVQGEWHDDTPYKGFLSTELEKVSPSSVVGEAYAVDENGKIIPQQIDPASTEIQANIIAELQSLRKRVKELEDKDE